MKKVFFVIFFIFMFAIAVSAARFEPHVQDAQGNTYVSTDKTFYLPSHVNKTDVKFTFDVEGVKYILPDNTRKDIQSGDSINVSWYKSNDVYGNICYNVTFVYSSARYTYTFYFANNLPSVHVNTENEAEIKQNNTNNTNASISIINKDGSYEYNDSTDGYGSKIKARGNATKSLAKLPYKVKLAEKKNLFGMGKNRDWILLANYLDQSLLRNSVMYKLAESLGMKAMKFQSVDLYVNGEYYGVYTLCQKVEIAKDRVDIFDLEEATDLLNPTYNGRTVRVTKGELIDSTILTEYTYVEGIINPADITGGYLVELDNNYWQGEKCYFITENGNHYVVKSPENVSKEQMEYIAKLFADMEEAMASSDGKNRHGKHYTDYIDLDSLAIAYIMAEFGRNYDAGSSSMYFYKDRDIDGVQSKIYKGPLWDCDNTLGNILRNGAGVQDNIWAAGSGDGWSRKPWYWLVQHDDFNLCVKKHFEQAYDIIYDMIDAGGYIEQLVMEIGTSIVMDQVLHERYDYSTWPMYHPDVFPGTHQDMWKEGQGFYFAEVYSDGIDADELTAIGYLCQCMAIRAEWLVQYWGCDVTPRQRTLNDTPVLPDGGEDDIYVPEQPDIPEPPEETSSDDTTSDDNTDTSTNDTTTDDTTTEAGSTDSSTEDSTTEDSSVPEESTQNSDKETDNDNESPNIVIIVIIISICAVVGAAVAFVAVKAIQKKK